MASIPYVLGTETSKPTSSRPSQARSKYNPYIVKKTRLFHKLDQNYIDLERCIWQIMDIDLELERESPVRTQADTEELQKRKEGLIQTRDGYGTQRRMLHEEVERLEQHQKEYKERKAAELHELKLSKTNSEAAQDFSQAAQDFSQAKDPSNERGAINKGTKTERK